MLVWPLIIVPESDGLAMCRPGIRAEGSSVTYPVLYIMPRPSLHLVFISCGMFAMVTRCI